jgi:pimeloyl-ACP methyl ester carboxylesterase
MRAAFALLGLTALVCVVLGVGAGVTSCSKSPPRSGTSDPSSASFASSAMAPAEGGPQIVTTADLVHLEYHVYGRGDPVVVLVHGWSCSSSYWNAQLADLKAKYTVVTLDLGGFGASGKNRSDWSMASFGADVATVASQFKGRPLVLVGHSMGGPVVLEAARILGNRVIGVIGVDTFKSLGLPPPRLQDVEARLEPMRADFIGETRKLIAGPGFFAPDSDPMFDRKIADDMSRARPEVAIPALEAMQSWDPTPALAALHVPLIAINSDLVGITDEARIRKVAPTFRLITVPRTGHFLIMEAPQRFNPILMDQIAGLTHARG